MTNNGPAAARQGVATSRPLSGKNLKTNATILINDKIAARGADPVNKYIQNILGMDYKSFHTSIFAKQKELNTLSSMNPSERRPLILRMLGIDSLDLIIREINSDKKNNDTLIKKLDQDIFDENGKNKIEKFKNEIQNQKKKKEKINFLIKEANKKIKYIKKR